MTGYLTGFMVYTLAMLGVIFIAFIVIKKTFVLSTPNPQKNFMKVESCLSLEPRKNLYVVKAGNERFLIAGGADGCRFMTKLSVDNIPAKIAGEKMQRAFQQVKNRNAVPLIDEEEIGYVDNYRTPVQSHIPQMSMPKISIPKIELPNLGQDYIGLKEILKEERVK
jgi:flagellar biogenesis protein FliO